jgi:hypothetical protein
MPPKPRKAPAPKPLSVNVLDYPPVMSGFEKKSLAAGQDQSRNGKNRNRPPSSLIPGLVVLFGFRYKNHFPLDCGIAGE